MAARAPIPARSGKRRAPDLPMVWQVVQSPLPSMISLPAFTSSSEVMSFLSAVSFGGWTSFCGTSWPTIV